MTELQIRVYPKGISEISLIFNIGRSINNNRRMKGKFRTRFILFLFAYIPIYLIVALKMINPDVFFYKENISSAFHIVKHNTGPVFLMLFTLFLLIYFKIYERISMKSSNNPQFTITKIDGQNKEYITYLGTYLLPFIGFDKQTPFDVAANLVLFLTIGMIYVRTDMIYTNPMLLFFRYDLYEITDEKENKLICISKDHFQVGDQPTGSKLGEKTYLIKKWIKRN
jgi:hypothetical protein